MQQTLERWNRLWQAVWPTLTVVAVWAVIMLTMLGCTDGGADSKGNNDTLFTGFSGIVIVAVILFFVYRHFKKKGAK